MLAEIFMVRLEATSRVSQEAAAASNSRFVPFISSGQFAFKDSGDRPVEPRRDVVRESSDGAVANR
jgi:hypothetical protein